MRLLYLLSIILLCGCASWNLHTACFDVNGTNLSTPYGPASGNLRICSETCVGTCPKAEMSSIEQLTNAEIQVDKKSIGSIPVMASITPTK